MSNLVCVFLMFLDIINTHFSSINKDFDYSFCMWGKSFRLCIFHFVGNGKDGGQTISFIFSREKFRRKDSRNAGLIKIRNVGRNYSTLGHDQFLKYFSFKITFFFSVELCSTDNAKYLMFFQVVFFQNFLSKIFPKPEPKMCS